jgi:hypothetical protein
MFETGLGIEGAADGWTKVDGLKVILGEEEMGVSVLMWDGLVGKGRASGAAVKSCEALDLLGKWGNSGVGKWVSDSMLVCRTDSMAESGSVAVTFGKKRAWRQRSI